MSTPAEKSENESSAIGIVACSERHYGQRSADAMIETDDHRDKLNVSLNAGYGNDGKWSDPRMQLPGNPLTRAEWDRIKKAGDAAWGAYEAKYGREGRVFAPDLDLDKSGKALDDNPALVEALKKETGL